MLYDDLRSFLSTLDQQGQLLRVTDEVLPEPDVAAAASAAGLRLVRTAPGVTAADVQRKTGAPVE